MARILMLLIILFLFSCGPKSSVHNTQRKMAKQENRTTYSPQKPPKSSGKRSAIPMRRDGGVYYVDVKINGVEMEVIFDTGASDVVISSIEALFLLKQGKLLEDDIIGTSYYQVANGDISSGTVINLRSVQIGDKILSDVSATIVENMDAPLLLGQSALDRFSSVSIDYNKNLIYIE